MEQIERGAFDTSLSLARVVPTSRSLPRGGVFIMSVAPSLSPPIGMGVECLYMKYSVSRYNCIYMSDICIYKFYYSIVFCLLFLFQLRFSNFQRLRRRMTKRLVASWWVF